MPPPLYAAPEHRYASFWQRAGAILIDGLVLAPLIIPFLVAFFSDISTRVDRIDAAGALSDADMADLYRIAIRWGVFYVAVNFVYQFVMIGLWGATVGKFALGLRVRRDDGSEVTWREAGLRPILQTATGVIPGAGIVGLLDYLWMLWDKQKQCLHDKVASTIVVIVR
jgi:uncharacterized RDD family membrane protein YckC